MRAGDGYEVCLFPFPYLYMSQDEGGDYSHIHTYNIDFLGWNALGRVLKCDFYAPVTLRCVAIFDPSANNRTYQSVDRVHLANGQLDYLTIEFAHDDNPPHNIGDIVRQGELLGHTGTTGNVTGDHTHSCCGQGTYQGFVQREGGHWDLRNRIHYWDACYTNDTVVVRGFNHNWHTYDGPIPPTPTTRKKKRFPWVLYINRFKYGIN